MTALPDAQPIEPAALSMSRTARLSFVVPMKPWTMNEANNDHHRVRANKRAMWRDAFARQVNVYGRAFQWCDVVVDHVVGTRRKVDVAACAPAAKAGLDGLVAVAGLLPDDSPTYVRSIRFNAPDYQQGIDALVLTLEGPVI